MGEYMKFRGKALSGTSLLTILGVLCFATVIVSAVVISSNTLIFASTTVTSPGTVQLSQTATPGPIIVGNNADYNFTANVPNSMTDAVLTVHIAMSGISTSDVTSATLTYDNGGTPTVLTLTDNGNDLSGTYNVGSQSADGSIPCVLVIVYATAGTYTVSATLTGTV
jgi:hypothetical protein